MKCNNTKLTFTRFQISVKQDLEQKSKDRLQTIYNHVALVHGAELDNGEQLKAQASLLGFQNQPMFLF